MKKFIALGAVMAFMPVLAFAKTKTKTGGQGINDIIGILSGILNTLMPFLIGLAVLFFVISLVRYLLKEGEEKAAAKTQMIWGIVILFVMISVWGLVNVLGDTFNLDTDTTHVPTLPGSSSDGD